MKAMEVNKEHALTKVHTFNFLPFFHKPIIKSYKCTAKYASACNISLHAFDAFFVSVETAAYQDD